MTLREMICASGVSTLREYLCLETGNCPGNGETTYITLYGTGEKIKEEPAVVLKDKVESDIISEEYIEIKEYIDEQIKIVEDLEYELDENVDIEPPPTGDNYPGEDVYPSNTSYPGE